jgi:hypothetical protein
MPYKFQQFIVARCRHNRVKPDWWHAQGEDVIPFVVPEQRRHRQFFANDLPNHFFRSLNDLDDLHSACHRMHFLTVPFGPPIRVVMMPHVASAYVLPGLMNDEPQI